MVGVNQNNTMYPASHLDSVLAERLDRVRDRVLRSCHGKPIPGNDHHLIGFNVIKV